MSLAQQMIGRACGGLWALVLLLLLLVPAGVRGQAFPIYDANVAYHDGTTTETWRFYPFHSVVETTSTLTKALHPLYSFHRNTETGAWDFDILWPVFTEAYRQEKDRDRVYRSTYLFPFYWKRKETRFGISRYDQMVLPILFRGRQGERGEFFILFPIVWYAYNARMIVPMFPPREQTFFAIFPLFGDFRGYWNRDRISFFLWPIYVYSEEGTGDRFNNVRSVLWPIFAKYGGHDVSGFRVWPLFAYNKKKGEYTRGFWLWPLGQYRKGRMGRDDPRQQQVTMFIPFFARFRQPNVSLDFVFPFYGKLEVGQRRSEGYFLALYNREYNFRDRTREDRYLWFIGRRKKPMVTNEGQEMTPRPDATLGGGFFPIYTRTYNATRVRKSVIWPIGIYKWNGYEEYEYERKYVLPLYFEQRRRFRDGDEAFNRFFFPIFRRSQTLDGTLRTNVIHPFWYNDVRKIDRLYAPLWTWWERRDDTATGAATVRVMKNLSVYERTADGGKRRRVKALFYSFDSQRDAAGERVSGHTNVLLGLYRKEKTADGTQTRLLGFTVARSPAAGSGDVTENR